MNLNVQIGWFLVRTKTTSSIYFPVAWEIVKLFPKKTIGVVKKENSFVETSRLSLHTLYKMQTPDLIYVYLFISFLSSIAITNACERRSD